MPSPEGAPEPAGDRDPVDGAARNAPEGLLTEVTHDRVLTIPNLITVARLACLPVYLWLLLARDARIAAAILLAVLGATDFADGYVARHFDQRSRLGEILDPTADRLLFFAGIGGIIAVGGAPLVFSWAVLVREIAVATVTVVLTLRGVEPVKVTWFGKAGTFSLMFAFPLFLAGSQPWALSGFLTFCGWGWGIPGLVLSYYAAFRYVPEWRANVARARARTREGDAGG